MSDDLKQRGAPDRRRISLQRHEVKWAARHWQVSQAKVREAIASSGPSRAKVARAVQQKKSK